jgi:hypothetical protein
VTGNRTLVAQFQAQQYTITATANPTNGGTISGNQSPYTYGQTCSLTATPANSNYTFANWTENGQVVQGAGATYSFPVTANRNLVANFTYTPPTYTITVSANPSNGGTAHVGGPTGPTTGTYTQGQSCTIYATANEHYTFTNWKKGNSVVSTNATYTFDVTESATYTAYFTQDPQYTITATANPTNGGTVTGGGTYYAGTTVNLTANAYSGFTFGHWQDGNTNNPRTITVTGNATYTAYFEAQPQAPEGAINGKFTINANGDQVYFSKGNLQYNKTTQVWSFMEHQYDIVETNGDVGENYANQNIVSLFGWGTSGWSGSGAIYYRPWDTDASNSSLYGPPGQCDLTGAYAQADWGVNNPISNGCNTANQWRTLTIQEWQYVIFDRITPSCILYAKAMVNNICGLILLPDDWNSNTYNLINTNISNASFGSNILTAPQWSILEQAGAVFLPVTGSRSGTSVYNEGSLGYYWSSTHDNWNCAYIVYFNSTLIYLYYDQSRSFGYPVRLVRSAQ